MNPYGSITLSLAALSGLVLLCHLWYDLHVQGAFVSSAKRTDNFILALHAATWTLVCAIPFYLVGTLRPEQVGFLFITHCVMDWTKCHRMPTTKRWPFVFDQVFHLVTLGVCLWQW